jgi:Calcineurin-like phosphoesterase
MVGVTGALSFMKFDIIGGVHAQHDKLVGLLKHLDYDLRQGTWRHIGRTAIFVGDLIDRGPDQVRTVELVRRMAAVGVARCILGNHEFNAIAWPHRIRSIPVSGFEITTGVGTSSSTRLS